MYKNIIFDLGIKAIFLDDSKKLRENLISLKVNID